MLLKIYRATFLFLIYSTLAISGQAQTGNTIYRFLEVVPSAQAAALGGNHVALFNNQASHFYLNPAYLTPESSQSVSATFVNYLADARYGFANASYHVPSLGTVGVGLRYFGYGDLQLLDENGNQLGDFSAGDLAISTALSTQLSKKMFAGGGIQFIHSSYQVYRSTALTGSAGLYYLDKEADFSAGLSIRNLGDQLSAYNGLREDIPFDVSVGFSKKPDRFPFRLNVTIRQLNNRYLRVLGETETPSFLENLARHTIFGGEASLGQHVMLRLGYNRYAQEQARSNENFDFSGLSMGVGITIKGIIVDLSRSSMSSIGSVLQLSVRTQIN